MRSHLLRFSGMFSAVVCVGWCAKTLNLLPTASLIFFCYCQVLRLSVWTWGACALSSSQWWAKVSWYGCSTFLWSVWIVCPSSCPLWKLLLLQPTIWSAISGYRGSPAHTFVVPFAGHLLLEFASWNCLKFLDLLEILKMHRKGSCLWWLKAAWLSEITAVVLWGCDGVGNRLIWELCFIWRIVCVKLSCTLLTAWLCKQDLKVKCKGFC